MRQAKTVGSLISISSRISICYLQMMIPLIFLLVGCILSLLFHGGGRDVCDGQKLLAVCSLPYRRKAPLILGNQIYLTKMKV